MEPPPPDTPPSDFDSEAASHGGSDMEEDVAAPVPIDPALADQEVRFFLPPFDEPGPDFNLTRRPEHPESWTHAQIGVFAANRDRRYDVWQRWTEAYRRALAPVAPNRVAPFDALFDDAHARARADIDVLTPAGAPNVLRTPHEFAAVVSDDITDVFRKFLQRQQGPVADQAVEYATEKVFRTSKTTGNAPNPATATPAQAAAYNHEFTQFAQSRIHELSRYVHAVGYSIGFMEAEIKGSMQHNVHANHMKQIARASANAYLQLSSTPPPGVTPAAWAAELDAAVLRLLNDTHTRKIALMHGIHRRRMMPFYEHPDYKQS